MNARRHSGAALILPALILPFLAGCRRVQPQAAPNLPTSAFVAPSCSLESSSAVMRAGDLIQLHVNTVFPNAFPLTYYWTSQAGTLRGKGTDMIWRPKDAAPGTYRVSARVDDGHGHEAACSIAIEVVANLD